MKKIAFHISAGVRLIAAFRRDRHTVHSCLRETSSFLIKMAKILVTLALCLVGVVIIQGAPSPSSYDDVIAAAKAGQWDQVQDLLSSDLAKQEVFKPLSFNNVRNLKPVPDGQVYGEAEYSYHTASNINGQTLEDAGGHKVINNNGKVREFNFTPDTDKFRKAYPKPATGLGALPPLPPLPSYGF
ncbi:uncharacterized protein LOC113496892 [Trichoplusia ni]|uniref:Uncharacterized protein LOC113496892 n=1 Tax=Trichoplusia ni TaxID=7111 RepID=A0A7E5VUS0_TRINI|nr:uncharacterized protein LOC113496892 [Trichoplusia ni]